MRTSAPSSPSPSPADAWPPRGAADGLGSRSHGSTDVARTRVGSTTHIRPQRNASWLASTAAPFRSMACSIASARYGRRLRLGRPTPSRKTFAVVDSPNSPSVRRRRRDSGSSPARVHGVERRPAARRVRVGGVHVADHADRSGSWSSTRPPPCARATRRRDCAGASPTSRSKTRYRSTDPAVTLLVPVDRVRS